MSNENVRAWEPDPGWQFRRVWLVAHECGWTATHPTADPGGLRGLVAAHNRTCVWPDQVLVETVSD